MDILLKDVPTLNKNRPLLDAIEILDKENIDCICVNDDGKPVGVLSYRDMLSKIGTQRLRAVAPESLYISGFMRPFPVALSNDSSVRRAAKLMLELSAPSLPVFYGDTFLGLVYKREMLRFVKDSTLTVTSIVRRRVPIVKSHDRVIHARKLLLDQNLSMIPVVNEDGRPVGIITEREVLKALIEFHKYVPEKYQRARIRQLTISSSMVANVPLLEEGVSLGEVSEKILNENLPGVIFSEPSQPKIMGILTPDEVLDYIVRSFPEEQ
ncbi:MAG: CBS domain-containing protein [Candidatus Methanomethyliaceae archaeon]|nr:CBS domain-containing protein [Candidatus Methanomethyliaceae archaeon]